MNIYISSSWKNREQVREMAVRLRLMGHKVFDFTDQDCRSAKVIPPERFTEQFDPGRQAYSQYMKRPEWKAAVMENYKAVKTSDLVVLLLPAGNDSHADWALGIGMGIKTVVVGQPRKGERSPTHLWADAILDDIAELYEYVGRANLNLAHMEVAVNGSTT